MSGLSQVGFRVFQTQENADINPRNMPNISLEINPNVGASNYTIDGVGARSRRR